MGDAQGTSSLLLERLVSYLRPPRARWALLLMVPVVAQGQVPPARDAAKATVVRAVLFYSPHCPHCLSLIENGLPPIRRRFGERLQIASVNVTTADGQALYTATLDKFSVPQDGRGVPTLVVGSQVLVGSDEIPAKLPGIVERGLASGGMAWPDVALLKQALEQQPGEPDAHAESAGRPPPPAESAVAARARADSVNVAAPVKVPPRTTSLAAPQDPAPTATGVPIGTPETFVIPVLSAGDRFLLDPIGNSVSVVVLLIMVVVLVVIIGAMRNHGVPLPHLPGWMVPVLALLGAGVAAYLAFVEVTGAHAVCGPVGDCNTVQQSAYARLLGVPVGLLGVGGYLAIIVAWTVGVLGQARTRGRAWIVIWSMALVAVLFSIYLTFLEPFVIGATCAWCISSAVIVTLILLVATPAAARVLRQR